jgi:tetratricopeptide (TPR) repeat protein
MRYTCSPSRPRDRQLRRGRSAVPSRACDPSTRAADVAEPQHRLCELGGFEEAVAQCDRALLLGGDQARGHALRASSLPSPKRGADALASCDQPLEPGSGNGEIHFNRGNLLQDLWALRGGASELCCGARAGASMSASSTITVRLCGKSAGTKRPCKATTGRSASIRGHGKPTTTTGAALSPLTGRLDEAVSAFEHAIALAPRDPESHANRQCAAGSRAPSRSHAMLYQGAFPAAQ